MPWPETLLPMNFMLAATDPVSHVLPHNLHKEPIVCVDVPGDATVPTLFIKDGVYRFFITNHLMMSAVAAITVILVFAFVAHRMKPKGEGLSAFKTKGRLAQLFETMCWFVRDEVVRPNLGHATDKYIYYVWTIFFFILFSNVMGLIPLGSVLYTLSLLDSANGDSHLSHWGGTATGNLSLNVVLAMGSFIAIVYIGIKETGVKAFFSHFNPIGWDDPVMLLIGIPLYILEWMGLIIKCVVLAMRLFGTMMAGHLVIAAFIGLVFMAAESSKGLGYAVELSVVVGGILLTLLELFICFLQAFIFTFLTVLFISMVSHDHGHDDDQEHDYLSDEDQMDLDKLIQPKRMGPMAHAP